MLLTRMCLQNDVESHCVHVCDFGIKQSWLPCDILHTSFLSLTRRRPVEICSSSSCKRLLLSWCRAWFQNQKPFSHRRRHVAVDEQAVHTFPHGPQCYAAQKPRFVDLGLFVWPLVLTSELSTRAYALQSRLSHPKENI